MKTYKIPAADALELFAAKHPDLPRDVALNKEAKKNLVHYSTTQPVAFAKMQWAKAKRMWFFYYRGGGVHYISTAMRIWQVVLVLAAGLGLLAGLIRRRDALLGAALLDDRVLDRDPHDRGLPGPLQRPADAAADRDRRRRLVPRGPPPAPASAPERRRPSYARPNRPRAERGGGEGEPRARRPPRRADAAAPREEHDTPPEHGAARPQPRARRRRAARRRRSARTERTGRASATRPPRTRPNARRGPHRGGEDRGDRGAAPSAPSARASPRGTGPRGQAGSQDARRGARRQAPGE